MTTNSVEAALWRAIAVFRVVALGYAAVLIAKNWTGYKVPLGGWAVLAVMAAWTAFTIWGYSRLEGRARWTVAVADLVVPSLCLLATGLVEHEQHLWEGRPNLTVSWVAAPVMVWALMAGVRGGVGAAVLIGIPDLSLRAFYADRLMQNTFNGVVLLLMVGVVIGYMARLALETQERLARAIAVETATHERQRLARDIHDSVLQVLALVQRRGGEMGGEAAELGRLAGEQEAALRALIGTPAASADEPDGEMDLRTLLSPHASALIQVSTPATPVRLPARKARELAAAVKAALDNVTQHCPPGTHAWVLVEDDADQVTVSVRDDGPGMPEGRAEEAEADGRLGLAQSVRGRIHDLGGTVTVCSAPGQGTELELAVPR